MKSLKTKTKLGVGFLSMAILIMAMAAITVKRLNEIKQSNEGLFDQVYAVSTDAINVKSGIFQANTILENILQSGDEAGIAAALDSIKAIDDGIFKALDNIGQKAPVLRPQTREVQELFSGWKDARNKMLTQLSQGDNVLALATKQSKSQFIHNQTLLIQKIQGIIDSARQNTASVRTDVQQTYSSTINLVFTMAAVGAFICLMLYWITVSSMTQPLKTLIKTEETSSIIAQNATNLMETENIAQRSVRNSANSEDAVAEILKAINQIAPQISIIEQISRQNNLLALNAANEAASAGSAEKGFAVLADKAAELIKDLIPNIHRTSELVNEITAASQEQKMGIKQINEAVQALDHSTQPSASVAKQVSSTASQLSSKVSAQNDRASYLKIKNSVLEKMKSKRGVSMKQLPENKILELEEEQVVQKNHFSDFDKHKKIHKKLLADAIALKSEYNRTQNVAEGV